MAVLAATAALTKSAQFPFHSWLPETMEAPTPVSALMHAGIINAGGALLLRFAPVIVRVPAALLLLTVVGSLTAVLGMLAMWSQVKVKRTLAWSTVGQMGFMMVQCGLAAFPAALVHILGHGLYKAWSFLRTGDLPNPTAARRPGFAGPHARAGRAGDDSGRSGAGGGRGGHGVLARAISRRAGAGGDRRAVDRATLGRSGGKPRPKDGLDWAGSPSPSMGTFGTALAAFSLYRGAEVFLGPVIGHLPPPTGPWSWAAAIVPVAALASLTVVQALLPALSRGPVAEAFYVHALNGFYFGAIADDLVTGPGAASFSRGKESKHA